MAIGLGLGAAVVVARGDADAVDFAVGEVVAAVVAGDAASGIPVAHPAKPSPAAIMIISAAFFMNPPKFSIAVLSRRPSGQTIGR